VPASSERLWHGPMPGAAGSCWHRGRLGGLVWASRPPECSSSSSSGEVPLLPPAVLYRNRDVLAAAHHVCCLAPDALDAACK
jgi:hypothetical protein